MIFLLRFFENVSKSALIFNSCWPSILHQFWQTVSMVSAFCTQSLSESTTFDEETAGPNKNMIFYKNAKVSTRPSFLSSNSFFHKNHVFQKHIKKLCFLARLRFPSYFQYLLAVFFDVSADKFPGCQFWCFWCSLLSCFGLWASLGPKNSKVSTRPSFCWPKLKSAHQAMLFVHFVCWFHQQIRLIQKTKRLCGCDSRKLRLQD